MFTLEIIFYTYALYYDDDFKTILKYFISYCENCRNKK